MLLSDELPVVTEAADQDTEENYEELQKVEIDVEVSLGRKKKGCSGLGVCKISGIIDKKDFQKGESVLGKAVAVNGQISSIQFIRKSMNKNDLVSHFSGRYFVVEEDFSETFTYKGRQFTLNLKVGKYPLRKTGNGFLAELLS